MLSAPSTRIPLGAIQIGAQRYELYLSTEWARYFESITSQVQALGAPPDQAPLLASMLGGGTDAGEVDGFPGPPGPIGPDGATGAALFMLQETHSEQDPQLRPGADMASPPPIGATVPAAGTFTTLTATGGFGCNGKAAQGAAASGGTLAGVIAALVANGILSS